MSAANNLEAIFPRAKALGILQKLPIFAGLFEEEFDVLLDICNVYRLKAGTVVFKEGDPPKSMYIVMSGKIEISTQKQGVVHVMKTSEILGEMGVITQAGRTATARAMEKIVLLEIKKTDFNFMLGKQPRVSFIIMKNIAASLAERLAAETKKS